MCKGVNSQGWLAALLERVFSSGNGACACVCVCVDHMQLCVHGISLRLHSGTEFQCVQQRVSVRREARFNRAADGVSGVW